MDRETEQAIKRIERLIGDLQKEDRLLRERIAASSGASGGQFFAATTLNGTLSVGNGISGGGTFPGTVTISVDLRDAWSGMWFDGGELTIDLDATFAWAGSHSFANGLSVLTADITFDSDSYGIISSTNTAGHIYYANGTRYVPAAANANVPVPPNGQGDLLRATSGPVWEAHAAGTDGAAIVGDGTDVGSTLTPEWKGIHTFQQGSRGELLATHTAMGEAHGLGGQVVVAPCAALRTAIVVT